jgi:glutamine amidotransferase
VIGIVDYGMGNLGSVANACRFLDLRAEVIADPSELAACRAVILPGVGAFGDCMEHIAQRGFADPLKAWIARGRPLLGICVGLQALFESSEESPGAAGLGILKGTVRRFAIDPSLKVPQMGWNRVRQARAEEPMFAGVPDGSFFYFVHSYYAAPADPAVVAGTTEYGLDYCSAVRSGSVFAVQFHPEKSQAVGLQMLRNFGAIVQGGGGAA